MERLFEQTHAISWLECVRMHSGRIESLHREIVGLEQAQREVLPWTTSGSGGGSSHTHSDPTATQAQARVEGLETLLSERRDAYDESIRIVGECGTVIERMRQELGERHGEVIELYYIDRAPTWAAVASEMRVSRTEVMRLRRKAYAWIEEHMP